MGKLIFHCHVSGWNWMRDCFFIFRISFVTHNFIIRSSFITHNFIMVHSFFIVHSLFVVRKLCIISLWSVSICSMSCSISNRSVRRVSITSVWRSVNGSL
uniref:Uncharacterized protein n=1 Tax=Arundo donax TaxID=35708 RepID=A0A0A9G1K8_ARUDO